MEPENPESAAPDDVYGRVLHLPPGRRPPSYYELLGLEPSQTDEEEIHAAVLRQSTVARKWALDPDRERARRVQALLTEITHAGTVLQDPSLRGDYDRALALALERGGEELPAGTASEPAAPVRKFEFRKQYEAQ